MRFAYTAIAALCAAVVSAQNNAITISGATLAVTAGQPLTLSWTNPSSGTVTIKLQQDPVTPDSGAILASGIAASSLTTTVQIPAAGDVNSHLYTIEIIDDTNDSNINFSTNFGITGATGTATGVMSGSATSTSFATGSATTTISTTGSSTDTSSGLTTSTLVPTISSTDSTSSTATVSSSNSSSSASASTTSSQQSSSSTSSAAPTESTSAPNSGNGAGSLKVQGGLLAMAVGLFAVI